MINRNDGVYLSLSVLTSLTILATDLFLPLGIATATLYIIPILISWQVRNTYMPLIIGGACLMLTLTGFIFSSDPNPDSNAPEVNRLISIIVITSSALIAFTAKRNIRNFLEARSNVKKANKRLKAKNREIEQFAYIASHDLQEPVRTIISMTEMLSEDYETKLDPKAKQMLKFTLEASERMKSLIKGLLDYSRVGKQRKLEELNSQLIVQEVINSLSKMIDESKAKIEVADLPILNGYSNELYQLFLNLISNAIKYAKNEVPPEVKINYESKESFHQFCIEDNGIGIDAEHFEKIFVIFQRLHSKDQYDGIGIGLANCKKIISLHEGEIWVESDHEKGSKFYFTISRSL